MLALKWITRAKSPLSRPFIALLINPATRTSTITGLFFSTRAPVVAANLVNFQSREVEDFFKDWFRSGRNPLFDEVFRILAMENESLVDSAMSRLRLRLNDRLVLEVLSYGKDLDVLSCLKFFDWAGRQPGFSHTRKTLNSVFKILAKERMMGLILEFLDEFGKRRYISSTRYHDVLVMGYAVVGKPNAALQVFVEMRFSGLDLGEMAYHALLNSLVEEGLFDVGETILKQIRLRNFENEMTYSIVVKSFCMQKRLEEAERYVEGFIRDGKVLNGCTIGILVDAFFESGKAKKVLELVGAFSAIGKKKDLKYVYGSLIRGLVRSGKLDDALEFLKAKNLSEGYVPDLFRCNQLVFRLLKENRLQEVYYLLMEMKEDGVSPDRVTIDAALCFLCKGGMADAAIDLFNAQTEFRLSPSSMAYNYLIRALCEEGKTDEAYTVLRSSADQGYSSSKTTLSILADALCREGKLDKVKELVFFALERNIVLRESSYKNFISALCYGQKVDDGYLTTDDRNRMNPISSKHAYFRLIHSINEMQQGDIAARLIIELQEKGHIPNHKLFKAIVYCVCKSSRSEQIFNQLLDMQLSRFGASCYTFNCFIDGAAHAHKPLLARGVYDLMATYGISPNLDSDILMLQCYLRSGRISNAKCFFEEVKSRQFPKNKFYNAMVAGLCKANKPADAWEIVEMMRRDTKLYPSLECYELLVQSFCREQNYTMAVKAINDMEKVGYSVTAFIGNVLILHSFKGKELHDAWKHERDSHNEMSSIMLGRLIGILSGCIKDLSTEELEELLSKCFPVNIHTYDRILLRLSLTNIDAACELFNSIRIKGYEPSQRTYDILVRGLIKHGRTAEAKKQVNEMLYQGFDFTDNVVGQI